MDNNVVDSLCEEMITRSLISFKFNFRGVGNSEGTFDEGIGEQEDIKAAISHISKLKEVDITRIGLAGYSAGAAWGLAVGCSDIRVKALAAISPPFSIFDFGFLRTCTKPKFLISGIEDNLIPAKYFREFCESLPESKECYTIEGADHFWQGYEIEAAEKAANFFSRVL